MSAFKRKEKYVDAKQFTGGNENGREITKWAGGGAAYVPATSTDPREFIRVMTPIGEKSQPIGTWIVKTDQGIVTYKDELFQQEYVGIEDGDSKLVAHARYELSLFPNEDPGFVESIINAIKGFAEFGHSGGSAPIAIDILHRLLRYENLLPLTNDPEEWTQHGADVFPPNGVWQNNRNSRALSLDEGKTYYFVDDEKKTPYPTQDKNFEPEIDPEDLKSEEEANADG